jgi:hypothetical protein
MDDDRACTATFDTCSGESIYDVPGQSVSGTMGFEACNVLRAGTGGFQITGTGNVTFYAGNGIELQNGFAVANGGVFSAVIGAPMGAGSTPLLNGDFESGRTVWTEYATHGWPLIVQSTDLPSAVPPHGGSWAAWLGGAYDATSYIEQNVTIPVSTPYLTYWHWIGSEDLCGYDFAKVVVDSSIVDTYDLCTSVLRLPLSRPANRNASVPRPWLAGPAHLPLGESEQWLFSLETAVIVIRVSASLLVWLFLLKPASLSRHSTGPCLASQITGETTAELNSPVRGRGLPSKQLSRCFERRSSAEDRSRHTEIYLPAV